MADIQKLLDSEQWEKAQEAIQRELLVKPDDHWLWFTLSSTFYERKEYDMALRVSQHAVRLAPDCPLALWHFAGALYMTGHEQDAFAIWLTLRSMDLEEVAHGEHGEGMDWAMQLINDVQYRIARYHQYVGQDDLAKESFRKYLHNRRHGVASIYDQKVAEDFIAGRVAKKRSGRPAGSSRR